MNFGPAAPLPEIAAAFEVIFYGAVVVAAFAGGYLVGKCRV